MQQSMILEILYGNRGSYDAIKIPSEKRKYMETINNIYERLTDTLNENQKMLLDKFIDSLEEENNESVELFYEEGFKVGIRLGIECMSEI